MVLQNMPINSAMNEDSSHLMETSEIDPSTFLNSIDTISNSITEQTVTLNSEDGSTFQTVSVPSISQEIAQLFKYSVIVGPDTQNIVNDHLYIFVPPEYTGISFCKEGTSFPNLLSSTPIHKTDLESEQNIESTSLSLSSSTAVHKNDLKSKHNCQNNNEQIECYSNFEDECETVEINLCTSEYYRDASIINQSAISNHSQNLIVSDNTTTEIPVVSKTGTGISISLLSKSDAYSPSVVLHKTNTSSGSNDVLSKTDTNEYSDIISKAVTNTSRPMPYKPDSDSNVLSNSDSCCALISKTYTSNNSVSNNGISFGNHVLKQDRSLFPKTDNNSVLVGNKDTSFEDRVKKRNALLPGKASRRHFKVITCDKCKSVFRSPLQYYSHRNIHLPKGKNAGFICAQCGRDLKDGCSLKNHELNDHGEVRLYSCPHCIHSFKTNALLDTHIQNIHRREKKYKCKLCRYKCFHVNDLKRHLDIHFDIKWHVCYFCSRQFSHPSNLMRHLRIHSNIKPHVCRICKRRYSQLSSLIAHEFSHKGGSCSECGVAFKTIKSLRNHLKEAHMKVVPARDLRYKPAIQTGKSGQSRIRYFRCQVCAESFRFKKALETHEEVAHSNSSLPCKSCFKVFHSINEIKLHSCTVKKPDLEESSNSVKNTKKRPTIPRKIYECVRCTNQFESFKESEYHSCQPLQKESYSDSGINKPEISVSECKLQNGEMVIYVISNEKEHSESEEIISFIEPITDSNAVKLKCEKENKTRLSKNKTRSQNKPKKKSQPKSGNKTSYSCETCSKTFFRKWNWSQHVATHDVSLRRYKCEECSASFSYRSTYTSHIRDTHSNQRFNDMFKCSQCSKTYKLKASLHQHIRRIHKKERNFQCNLCSKEFFNKSEFNFHMTIHREELPFTCVFCGKRFRHLSNLKRHERTHSGDRPHKCPYCTKTYIQPVTLRVHLKKHEALINVPKLQNLEDTSITPPDEAYTTDTGVS